LRLTTPSASNAYLHYQAVLEREPENAKAIAGMQRIIDTYSYLIAKAIRNKQFKQAYKYLQRAQKIAPDNTDLANLRERLLLQDPDLP